MKKNIQINLFGTLYNIDDDAYQLLERYLDSMKSYFMRQDGGEEIADDIEHRVAELLWQKKNEGMQAVDIETVKEIIAKIGNPQEIDGNTSAEEQHSETSEPQDAVYEEVNTEKRDSFTNRIKNNVRGRRLYRNGDDKKIAGVCSGLAEYTGVGDSTLWRLGFVLMPFVLDALLNLVGFEGSALGMFLITYLLLAFIVPLAKTPEDNLRMKGCEVTPESINEEILRETSKNKQKVVQTSNGSGCLTILLVCALVVLLFPLLALLCAIVLAHGIWFSDGMMQTIKTNMGYMFGNEGWMLVSAIVAVILVFAIPIILIIKKLRTGRFGIVTTCISLVLWLLMLGWTVVSAVEGFDRIKAKHISITTDNYGQSDDTTDPQTVDDTGEMNEIVDSVAIDLWSEE